MNAPKQTGIAHFFAAARYSLQGLRRLSQETAFRHEALLAVAMVVTMIAVGVGPAKLSLGIVLMLSVFGAEAINTAIEELADLVSPDFSIAVKHAKDLGSLMVALTILGGTGFCITVIAEQILK